MKDDTISRAAAIDAIDVIPWYHQNKNGEMVHGANSDEHQAWYKAEDIYTAIGSVPPVQLAQDLPKGCTDTISRQAAIDALEKVADMFPWRVPGNRDTYDRYNEAWNDAIGRAEMEIENMPSAQPDVPDTNVGELISRQAAIKALEETKQSDPFNRYEYQNIGIDWSIDVIKALPSAQPGWIPCTPETMPKNKSNVLTVIYIPGRQAHIRSGWYEDGLFMNDNGDTWKATDKEVVGWMYQPKLPNPREGGQDGKN